MTYPPDIPGSNPGSPQGDGPPNGGAQPPNTPPPGPPWGRQQPPPQQWGPPPSYPQAGPPVWNPQSAAPRWNQQAGPPPWNPQGGPPQWNPQSGPPPWQRGQPPRRSRAGLIATLAGVLVAAIALTAVIVANNDNTPTNRSADAPPAVATSRDRTTGAGTTAPRTAAPKTTSPKTTAAPKTTPPRTTAPRTTAPKTTAPRTATPRTTAPRTTAPRTTAPRTTAPRTATPTQSGPRSVFRLADNPFLTNPKAGLQNLVCNLPAWKSTPAAAEQFFRAQTTCLDAAWGPLLRYYDMPFTPPVLHFPQGSSFSTECGVKQVGIATAAYYCDGDLYVPFRGLQTDLYGDDPGVYMALFAHEYGHHVQLEAGILTAAAEKMDEYGRSSAKGLDISRRQELQAQCFSGMFLGSHAARGGTITAAMFDRAWQDQETRGDDTSGTHDHGTNAHYAAWWRQGAKSNRTAQCNTWSASAAFTS